MLNERQIEFIERKLTDFGADFADAANREIKERCRGYCQGVAYVLSEIGYSVEWDNGRAHIVKDSERKG